MSSKKDLATQFPASFEFGVATASYQIEGGAREGGRKPSIWDAFSHMPGRVYQGHTGDVACDHYHRWESDLDLIKSLNVGAYRFSIAWPRIIPDGRGAVNSEGLDFYERIVDGLIARGIKVFPTLYHWDLPLALAGYGGWTDRDTAEAFADYATAVVKRFGDRIDALATINEPWCATYLSHYHGIHAPGEKSLEAALAAVHVMNLAHGRAVQAARAERWDIPMGIVLNGTSIYPASDSPEDLKAAENAFQFNNGVFFGPIFDGSYDDDFMEALGSNLRLRDGDLAVINQPLDWWGFNYYNPTTVKYDPSKEGNFLASKSIPSSDSDHRTDIGWEVVPKGMSHFLKQAYDRYRTLPPCYITENGACYNMGLNEAGICDDQPRLDYVEAHLAELTTVIDQGIPVLGYFLWSLMDNYEWAEGYGMRFGIVHVDYDTQVRTVKKSGEWYKELVGRHRAIAAEGASLETV